MFRYTRIFATLIVCMFFTFAAEAQEQFTEWASWNTGITGEGWTFTYDKYKSEDAATARDTWQRLGIMKVASRDEWAGDYSVGGDTFLDVIRWTPEGGYVRFNTNLCTTDVRSFDFGDVVVSSPESVELISRYKPNSARKFIKIKWGEERYLIAEDEVKDFCDYIAGIGKYNTQSGFLGAYEFHSNRDDGDKPNAELPTVPAKYKALVRKPIDATIIRVAASFIEVGAEDDWSNQVITPVVIDAGFTSGVKRGMTLHLLGSGVMNEAIEIKRVYRSTSRGVIVRSVRKQPGVKINEWDDGYDTPQPPIVVGMKLTTGLYKQSQDYEEDAGENSGGGLTRR